MWGAGFTGLHGEDLVAEESENFRGQLGTGLYSEDPHSSEGEYRDLFGICLAWLRNLGNWIVWNANPLLCEDSDVLALLETQYGLRPAPATWSIEDRRERMRYRLMERKGSNPTEVRLQIEDYYGRGMYFDGLTEFTDSGGANDWCFLVEMYDEFFEDSYREAELRAYLDRICPAHLTFVIIASGPMP